MSNHIHILGSCTRQHNETSNRSHWQHFQVLRFHILHFVQQFRTLLNGPSLSLTYVCMYVRRALGRKVTVAPRSQTNRNVFSARLNRSVDKSAERREDGRLFQILAPATAKLRSPNVLLVRRTTNIAVSDDRSMRRQESAMSWQSSARYGGSWPSRDLWISSASLNSTRCRIGSQCSRRSIQWRYMLTAADASNKTRCRIAFLSVAIWSFIFICGSLSFQTQMTTIRHCCGVSTVLLPSVNVLTYLHAYWHNTKNVRCSLVGRAKRGASLTVLAGIRTFPSTA